VGLLGVADHDWFCTDIGLYRFRSNRKPEMASECCPERFIRCGHWIGWLFYIQPKADRRLASGRLTSGEADAALSGGQTGCACGADYLTVFTADQLQALVPLFLDLHEHGINIAGIFWGLWLFPMGYLVFKSGFLPRILGVLLMIGCFGYLIDSATFFLFPNFDASIAQFTFIGELLLPLWLLIKGVNVEQWEKRAH
jgi:hypothetical protein